MFLSTVDEVGLLPLNEMCGHFNIIFSKYFSQTHR